MPYESSVASPQTILVVEDYTDTRDMMKLFLQQLGYRVVEAADGLEAVEVAQAERPRFILMDMSLPRMDGYEATKLLRQLPGFQRTKIIACSALNRWKWRAKAIAAGCDAFLTKPLNLDELKSMLTSTTKS